MSSKLEQFIKEHRSEFNNDRPSANVWDEIEAALPQKRTAKVVSMNMLYKWVAAAAVVCIVLTSAYFIYMRKTDTPIVKTEPTQNEILKYASPADASQMTNAFNAIQTRQEQLKAATTEHPELYKEFLSDLQVLDSTYQMLQKQAAQTANRDVIMKAMIQNLQLQAELLYRQLMITDEIKKDHKKTSEAELKQQNPS
jgi:hypothetical protein